MSLGLQGNWRLRHGPGPQDQQGQPGLRLRREGARGRLDQLHQRAGGESAHQPGGPDSPQLREQQAETQTEQQESEE